MAAKERWDGWLGPKQWMPVVGILSLAVIALAVMLVLNLGDDDDAGATPASGGPGRVPTHEHADLALYIRGQRFDFNQEQFVTTIEEAVSPNVHIHAPRYDVVHVHTTLTKWDEFFRSLGFQLTDPSFPGVSGDRVCLQMPKNGEKLCNNATDTWKFVVNGVPVDGVSNVNIGDMSRVLFSYGPESIDEVVAKQWPQVTTQACIPSELCIDRIPKDEPPEECAGRGQCN